MPAAAAAAQRLALRCTACAAAAATRATSSSPPTLVAGLNELLGRQARQRAPRPLVQAHQHRHARLLAQGDELAKGRLVDGCGRGESGRRGQQVGLVRRRQRRWRRHSAAAAPCRPAPCARPVRHPLHRLRTPAAREAGRLRGPVGPITFGARLPALPHPTLAARSASGVRAIPPPPPPAQAAAAPRPTWCSLGCLGTRWRCRLRHRRDGAIGHSPRHADTTRLPAARGRPRPPAGGAAHATLCEWRSMHPELEHATALQVLQAAQ